jgi:hypothetical protein
MATYVKVAGAWREVTSDSPSNGVCGYVKVNGTWRTVNQSYVKINGVWRATCTAPGQQPPAIPETICYRPNYCLNGTNGVILPTTEPCYLADGFTLGTRTAPYTCQTDPGCITYTVPAGVCTAPDPIIQVVSEQIGDCELWGGISGCTSGYAKRITTRYSDNSLKVSYSCCNPLTPNLKYYCTLRPFSTGQCLNELKDTDFTGTVIAGQGEWVCEELGITSFPSCSTAENCSVPKTSTSTYEGCGYLNTGQRLVTTNTYQSWCEKTLETVIGDCIGADDPCGGKYCGPGSGEEEYSNPACQSGTAVRYKCLTPEGCNTLYTFRRCTTFAPPPPDPQLTLIYVTEVCSGPVGDVYLPVSCRQYSSYNPSNPNDANCTNTYSTNGYAACPNLATPQVGGKTFLYSYNEYRAACCGLRQINVYNTGEELGPCIGVCPPDVVVPPQPNCGCIEDSDGFCGANGIWQQYYYDPCGITNCPTVAGGPCGSGNTGPAGPDCSVCFYGSGTESCGSGGTRTYCITPVGCPDIYGPCVGGTTGTTPSEPPATNPTGPTFTIVPGTTSTSPADEGNTWVSNETTNGGSVLDLVDNSTGQSLLPEPIVFPPPGDFGFGGKSININTLVRTRDGLVAAHDLKVGDKLLSADIATFPYDNLLATNIDLIEWTAQNPHINLVETEIVNLRTRISKWAVIVDSDIFSDSHYILVNRNDVTKFVKAIELERTDLIWSNIHHNWLSIGVLKKVDVNHEVVSIDCEPYDIFFTERMLTHDSNTVD